MSHPSCAPAPGHVRLATSSPSTSPTTALTLHQIHTLATRAAKSHIDILLLPEAYIGGYPRGSAFGCVIGGRSAEGRDEFLKYFESAVDLGDSVGEGAGGGDSWVKRELEDDGLEGLEEQKGNRGDGTREELERIAAETGVFIVVGLIEKAGGSLYCAVVYVCPQRGMIGKRRKVMPVSLRFPREVSLICYPHLGILPAHRYIDRHRAPHLGTRLTSHPSRRFHRHPRDQGEYGGGDLLGELHAATTAGAVCAEREPVSGADCRWA